MKKTAIIVLLCIYSLSSLGVGFKAFYCCGKLQSISVSLAENKKSSNESGCCKTKYQSLKVKDQHLTAGQVEVPNKRVCDLAFPPPTGAETLSVSAATPQHDGAHVAPPIFTARLPLYLYNRVFRI